jgi:hypothetical protein
MLSKKRVRTKSNTRTKSKRITKSRKFNKKRVKRVSTKQRGGVKRRRTKKSKKKSQKGGNFKIKRLKFEIMTKINLLPILDWQKQELLGKFEQSPEQAGKVEQIIQKIQEGKSFEDAMAAVEETEQLPYYNHPPSENGKCEEKEIVLGKGHKILSKINCKQITKETDCEEHKVTIQRPQNMYAPTQQNPTFEIKACKWTPA